MPTTILLPTLQDTQHLGYLLGKHLAPGSTLLLTGNLGAGKTSLVQGIGRGLDLSEPIVSPTYNLIDEHLEGRIPLYHLDLYRLEPSQVESIYPEMYWEGREVEPGITAIEWSQRLSVRPSHYLAIELTTLSSSMRQACIQPSDENIYDLKFIESFSPAAR